MILDSDERPNYQKKRDTFHHQRMRAKLPIADISCLTDKSIADLVSWWSTAPKSETRCLAMCVLITGRSLQALLDPEIDFHVKDCQGEIIGELETSWKFSPPPKAPTSIDEYEKSVSRLFILIPSPLAVGLQHARIKNIDVNILKKNINSELSKLENASFQRVTLDRMQHYLQQVRHQFGLSATDIEFISNSNFRWAAHAHYGVTSLNNIYHHHQCFIESLISQNSQINLLFPNETSEYRMGSNRVITDLTLTNIFEFIINRAPSKISNSDDIRHFHNHFTTYTVLILQISTLHRPKREIFKTLGHFSNDFSSVVIYDKNIKSRRRIPLCIFAQRALENYITYLKSVRRSAAFIYPDFVDKISSALKGSAPLFYFLSAKKFGIYSPSVHFKCIFGEYFNVPANFTRHKIKTMLCEENTPPEYIKAFLAHTSDFEANDSLFSSRTYTPFNKISTQINDYFLRLRISRWEPTQ